MIPYPKIDPEIIRIGPLAVRWYGLMYLLGFAASYLLVWSRVRKRNLPLSREFLDTFYAFLLLGLILGARLGYVLFYDLSSSLQHPLGIFAVWQGGMSFHGGLIGSVLAGIWCCKRYQKDPWLAADLVSVTAPIGLGLGRLGNFINGELYGRTTDVPWAMLFPGGGPLPRHPSQLYELFLEGIVLFAVLWTLKDRVRRTGMITALFVLLYGLFRSFVEFFREPDPQLGFIAGPFTMGQVLSATMIVLGALLLAYRAARGRPVS
ncbi:MAG: prolipoprotein diacylglyceryl transferase [Nitrospirae bacterium GWD2_57_9]|nr:MAG: prolipoprotein diacylglyceryl transferase [Nitrospirae bacterium GWD2_57_9]